MGSVTRTKLMSVMALCAMIGLLLLPILVAIPALAGDGGAPAADAKKEGGGAKIEKGKDVYYKTEGIVSGPLPQRRRTVRRTTRDTILRVACCCGSPTSSICIMVASCWLCRSSAWSSSSWGW